MFPPATATAGRAGRRVARSMRSSSPPRRRIPQALVEQLDDGGILVLPVGEQAQTLKRIQRHGNEFVVDAVEAVRFVPLVKGELA